jgi:hypothetical protein
MTVHSANGDQFPVNFVFIHKLHIFVKFIRCSIWRSAAIIPVNRLWIPNRPNTHIRSGIWAVLD